MVGRVELVPPLRPDEQQLSSSSREYKNKIVLLTGHRPRPVEDIGAGDMRGRMVLPLGQTFFVKADKETFYLVGATVLMKGRISSDLGRARLPALFRIDIQPTDRAVYVGTLRYHRDEFFGITRVELVDDYEHALTEFRNRFGARLSLRKSLLRAEKAK